jgi:hypothetical protein
LVSVSINREDHLINLDQVEYVQLAEARIAIHMTSGDILVFTAAQIGEKDFGDLVKTLLTFEVFPEKAKGQ